MFMDVQVLIYVIDIEDKDFMKELTYFKDTIESLYQNSRNAKVYVLVHKMDLIGEEDREKTFRKREQELQGAASPNNITCFRTSIWDETLFRAWSAIVYSLIPNIKTIEANLDNFTKITGADEIVIFEKATFLVIAHSSRKEQQDAHRFEKISNIIKQFKLSCNNARTQFSSMEVKSSKFTSFIEGFTSNSIIMVIVSDPNIESATIQLNVKIARKHFEKIINKMNDKFL
jgi:Ras-related GTP-binding protein A/B